MMHPQELMTYAAMTSSSTAPTPPIVCPAALDPISLQPNPTLSESCTNPIHGTDIEPSHRTDKISIQSLTSYLKAIIHSNMCSHSELYPLACFDFLIIFWSIFLFFDFQIFIPLL